MGKAQRAHPRSRQSNLLSSPFPTSAFGAIASSLRLYSMFTLSLSSFVKFLIGILLLQVATVLLVYTGLKTDLSQTWPLFGALGATIGVVAALWFNAIAESTRRQCLAKAQVGFSREREKIRVRAEKEKTKEFKTAHRQIHRQKQRSETGGKIKTGIVIGGAVSAGLVLLMTQMVTLGLLTLTTAGGAALGYGVRARQDRLGLSGRGLLGRHEPEVDLIEAKPAIKAVKGPVIEDVEPTRKADKAV